MLLPDAVEAPIFCRAIGAVAVRIASRAKDGTRQPRHEQKPVLQNQRWRDRIIGIIVIRLIIVKETVIEVEEENQGGINCSSLVYSDGWCWLLVGVSVFY